MGTVLFIENEHHTERHFTRGFRLGAFRSGWTPAVVWLRNPDGKLKSADTFCREIQDQAPDLIFWIMDSVLPRAESLMIETLRKTPKVSLWFDDYERTHAIHRHSEDHRRLCEQHSLQTHVWDGYWRQKFQERFSVSCHAIHLAADDIDYFPSEPTHFKGFENSLVFIGNIPSLDYILQESSMLPRSCDELIRYTHEILSRSPYGRLPYTALEEACQALPAKARIIVDHFRNDLARNILINRLVWMLGKREVRIRILRLAAQQCGLVILSGHSDKSFAQAGELSKNIGSSRYPVKFINTEHVEMHQLGSLYHIGGLHLQATDPQSVTGGIPFRVFETAASGRPLLSDFKPELVQCFTPGQEILCFDSDKDFPDKLSAALKNRKRLEEVAEASHQRFLREHTWKHRFAQILQQHHILAGATTAVSS